MDYINKPVRPEFENYASLPEYTQALAEYDKQFWIYEKQVDKLTAEYQEQLAILEGLIGNNKPEEFQATLKRMEEISSIQTQAGQRLLKPNPLTLKVPSTPKKSTKTVLLALRLEEELRDEFAAYCAARNVTVSAAIRDLIKWELEPSEPPRSL